MTSGSNWVLEQLSAEVHKRDVGYRADRCLIHHDENTNVVRTVFVLLVVLDEPPAGEDTRMFVFKMDTRETVLDSGAVEKHVKGGWQLGTLVAVAQAIEQFFAGVEPNAAVDMG